MDATTFRFALDKTTALQVLHENPQWLLADLDKYIKGKGPLADVFGALTVGELIRDRPDAEDPHRYLRRRGERLQGAEFDAFVLEIIRAAGKRVQAGYLRARAGGPRWKLQAACRRLADSGAIERSGVSADVHYWVGDPTGSESA